MKQKILLISLVIFASSMLAVPTAYFVSPTGDDLLNTGLSAESPFLTMKKVFEVELPTTNAEILINLAAGTYATSDITPTMGRPYKVTIIGESASTTIVERSTSEPLTNTDFRFFQLQNVSAGFDLTVRNITIQNFGNRMDKNWAGSVVLMNGAAAGVKVAFEQCVFKNNVAARGAIVQSSNATYEVYFDGCYFENCKSFDYGGTQSSNLEAPIYVTGGKLSVKNCIFNNNSKDPLAGTTDRDLKKGSLITVNPIIARITTILVNNTFVNNKIPSGKDEAISIQPVITIADMSVPKKEFGVDLTMLNNLFVDNKRTGFDNDVDLYVDPLYVTQIAVTNNVFNKIATSDQSEFISPITNKISTAFATSSAEIAFEMEADLPKIELAENGVSFVIAKGTEVVGKGLANSDNSEVPVIDIRNATRKMTPDIGATDVLTSSIKTTKELAGFKIFVNDGILNVINENQVDFSVRITDLTGRVIYTSSMKSKDFNKKFELRGISLITIRDAKNTYTQKVVF